MTASIQPKGNKLYVVLSWKNQKTGKREMKWVATDLTLEDKKKRRKTEKVCRDALKKYENLETLNNYEDILFSDYLLNWLEDTKNTISYETYHNYKQVISGVIAPYFKQKKIKLTDLKAYHIQDFYSYKMNVDQVTGNTIRHYHANISKALKYALKTDRILINPAERVELPRKEKNIQKCYTPEQLKQLLEGAKDTPIEPVIYLGTWFGLRRSEILGLKWDCVDFKNFTLSVKGTISRSDEIRYKNTGKTKSSIRTLQMPEIAVDYLANLKSRQESNQKRLGTHYNTKYLDFICVRDNGDLIKPDYATKNFSKVCKASGVPVYNLHTLRHSNISLLINSGATIKEAQIWAGHSNFSTTADIYTHLFPEKQIHLANHLQETFGTQALEIR